jgi:hypothetical protein
MKKYLFINEKFKNKKISENTLIPSKPMLNF